MLYSQAYRQAQETAKYKRMIRFADALPELRRQVERDLRRKQLSKEKVLAAIIKLMDETYFRVGNASYARQNGSYGITTLRSKHTDVKGKKVTFDFTGKSGQKQHQTVSDAILARLIQKLDGLPGYEIFQYYDDSGELRTIRSQDVNDYIKQHTGDDFTAKDFRTWGGTLLAVVELTLEARPHTKALRKKTVTACVKQVAKKLGNTPSVTRGSYIDPRVIEAFHDTNLLHETMAAIDTMKPNDYLKPEEQCVKKLLNTLA